MKPSLTRVPLTQFLLRLCKTIVVRSQNVLTTHRSVCRYSTIPSSTLSNSILFGDHFFSFTAIEETSQCLLSELFCPESNPGVLCWWVARGPSSFSAQLF